MFKEILISIDDLETRVAILEDGQLMEISFAREERLIGSIYKGKVANILPGMQAAFVDIGLERNAFLCMDDASAILGEDESIDVRHLSIKDILKVNQETLVQIIKESIGTKGARVTTHITLPGRYLVLLPTAQYIGVSRRIEDEKERERLKKMAESIRTSEFGLIVRTAAEGRDQEDLEKDFQFLVKLWEKIQNTSKKNRAPALIHQELTLVYKIIRDIFTPEVDRLIIDSKSEYEKVSELIDIISPRLKSRMHLFNDRRSLFEAYGLEAEIEKALRRKVWLDSGGYLIIDKTEALTVIDINTGKFIGKTSLADTILKTNLEAVPEIARQLRLRDLGGIIIIDFIDMERAEDRQRVLAELAEHLKLDRTKTHLVGITELGLVQLTRKRMNRDIDEYLREPCPYCAGRGRVNSLKTMRIQCEREIRKLAFQTPCESILVEVSPKLATELLGWEGEDLDRLEKATEKTIHLCALVDGHIEKVKIEEIQGKKAEVPLVKIAAGDEMEVTILDIFGNNFQNGLAVFRQKVMEIAMGGNRIGETLSVAVTAVHRHYMQAQIRE
ncbi:MAG: Rne/Rng family ribonuclease [Candidatus Eremiobacteraeota bacterium]|nr:Rne/Rng family ribonuclease [Candidatus Eremiobacteraeota bacterium]